VLPGEAAVLSYVAIAPGKLGLAMVAPVTLKDGNVVLRVRSLEINDSAKVRQQAEELLPDIFELDRTGVASLARLDELLHLMAKDQEVKTVNYPGLVSAPGQKCMIRLGGLATPEQENPTGTSYTLQADTLPDSEGWNLSVDFQDNSEGKGRRSRP
jgi:hypothetical protein